MRKGRREGGRRASTDPSSDSFLGVSSLCMCFGLLFGVVFYAVQKSFRAATWRDDDEGRWRTMTTTTKEKEKQKKPYSCLLTSLTLARARLIARNRARVRKRGENCVYEDGNVTSFLVQSAQQ